MVRLLYPVKIIEPVKCGDNQEQGKSEWHCVYSHEWEIARLRTHVTRPTSMGLISTALFVPSYERPRSSLHFAGDAFQRRIGLFKRTYNRFVMLSGGSLFLRH